MDAFVHGEAVRDLAVNPVQRIAVMRLLVCVAQAALEGPADEDEWLGCCDRIPSTVKAYLEKWQDRFDLYGEHAFLQVPDLEVKNNAVLDKLDFGLSAGNNSVLFDHSATATGRPHSGAWCALALLTYQCFSPGGLIGTTSWNGMTTTKTSEHAPGVEGSALHTLLRGGSLSETVHLNMLTKQMVATLPNQMWGCPLWEMDGLAPSDSAPASVATSFLGRLVPLSRAIRLAEGALTFTLANGLRYPKLPEGREVTGSVVMRQRAGTEQVGYVSVDLSRHPWRELSSILALSTPQTRASGPLAFGHLPYLGGSHVDIWTGGLAADKGKILDAGEWVFEIPVEMLHDGAIHAYSQGVATAKEGESALRSAAASYATSMKKDNTHFTVARVLFWSQLDAHHGELIEFAADVRADIRVAWYPIVRTAMEEAYGRACAHKTPRQIQAYAQGLRKLRLKIAGDEREAGD